MNIYLVEQEVHNGYDTYDSMVVLAASEEEASQIHPIEELWGSEKRVDSWSNTYTWADNPSEVTVTYLGKSETIGMGPVICTSFNAG